MRRRKSFIQQLNRLSFEEKIIGAASLVTVVACFLPWYGISSRIMDQWWNGFSNIGYVIGYVVFLVALAALYGILAPLFSLPIPKILERKFSYLALHGESAFLLTILSFIYAKYTVFDAPGSSVRFGLYTALIASFVGAIAGYVLWKKHVTDLRKKGLQEDFIKMPRMRNEYTEVEMEPEINNEPVVSEQERLMEEDSEDGIMNQESHTPRFAGAGQAGIMREKREAGMEPEINEDKVENLNKKSTVEELASSFQSGHQGLKTDEPEVDLSESIASREKEEDKMSLGL